MAIDPSIVLGLKTPTFEQRQAANVQLEDARAQTEQRQAEAMRAKIANQESAAKQSAGKAVQQMLQQKSQMGQTPTAGDFWLAAGPYGDEYLKMYHTGVSTDIANKKAQLDNAAKVSNYAGTLTRGMLAVKDQHARQQILADGVQSGVQSGILDPDMANILLKHGTTDAELQGYLAQDEPALKAQLEEQHKQFDDAQKTLDYNLKVKAADAETSKPMVVGGSLVSPQGKELFTAPLRPEAPMSPERFQQEQTLAEQKARLGVENKVDPTEIKEGTDSDGNPGFFIVDKKSGTIKQLQGMSPKEKVDEPPAEMKNRVSVSDRALQQSAKIREILNAHPEMVGPIMGRLNEFAQGVGDNPFAGDPKLEQLGATLTGHLRYLFAQELKNAIGARPSEYLSRQLEEASPQRKQDINLLNGFLDSVENNSKISIDSANTQYPGYKPFQRVKPGGTKGGGGKAADKDPLGIRKP